MDCDEVQKYNDGWVSNDNSLFWFASTTYRAKPKPKRVVTWVQWDEDDALCCDDRDEVDYRLKVYGGYIYRIERDPDGGNPTIELVKVGGEDD